jgi:GT2 family glycosyltransferase
MSSSSLKKMARAVRARLLSLGLRTSDSYVLPAEELFASRSISVVIPVHDSPEVVARCLASLARFAGEAQVIVVDDASELPQTRTLLNEYSLRHGWRLIRHSASRGHSRACETGVAASDREIICLLNSDTVVTPWSWSAAIEAFGKDSTIGATGPSTSWAATQQRVERAMHCRHHWRDAQIFAFARKHILSRPARTWVELEELSGFALFIRRSAWNSVGGFNPQLSDYGNESELCIRMRGAGWRLVWTQDSYIHHLGRQSYGALGRDVVRQRCVRARAFITQLYAAKSS